MPKLVKAKFKTQYFEIEVYDQITFYHSHNKLELKVIMASVVDVGYSYLCYTHGCLSKKSACWGSYHIGQR